MPKVKVVEKKMQEVEGVNIRFCLNGKDVRGDKQIPQQYQGKNATMDKTTVSGLKDKLKRQYPGYDFKVYTGDGNEAPGQMTLANVRETYLKNL